MVERGGKGGDVSIFRGLWKWKIFGWEGEKEKLTAPGIPRRSPIQVLTGPDVA